MSMSKTVDTMDDETTTLLPPTSAEAIISNARQILPSLAEEADESERIGRLTARAERLMRAAGVFELGVGKHRGGVEATIRQQVDVVTMVAEVDAGIAWNIGVLNAGGYYATRIPEEGFREFYSDTLDHPASGAFHPPGRADVVPGGYMVTGDWGWGSGSYTADYIIGGCLVWQDGEPVIGETGRQKILGIYLPREAIEVADDWQVLGVRASGSTSYAITTPVFVPDRHVFDREPLERGDKDPLNKSVHVAFVPLTGIHLGVARHLVALAVDYVQVRYRDNPARVDNFTLQSLGEAAAEVEFAYAGVAQAADLTDEILFTPGRAFTQTELARMTTANAQAGTALRRVLNITQEAVSAAYILDRQPIQRAMRDAAGALAHAGSRRTHLSALGTALLAEGSEQLLHR